MIQNMKINLRTTKSNMYKRFGTTFELDEVNHLC